MIDLIDYRTKKSALWTLDISSLARKFVDFGIPVFANFAFDYERNIFKMKAVFSFALRKLSTFFILSRDERIFAQMLYLNSVELCIIVRSIVPHIAQDSMKLNREHSCTFPAKPGISRSKPILSYLEYHDAQFNINKRL